MSYPHEYKCEADRLAAEEIERRDEDDCSEDEAEEHRVALKRLDELRRIGVSDAEEEHRKSLVATYDFFKSQSVENGEVDAVQCDCPRGFPEKPMMIHPLLLELKRLGIREPIQQKWFRKSRGPLMVGKFLAVTTECRCSWPTTHWPASMYFVGPDKKLYGFSIYIGQCRCGAIAWLV